MQQRCSRDAQRASSGQSERSVGASGQSSATEVWNRNSAANPLSVSVCPGHTRTPSTRAVRTHPELGTVYFHYLQSVYTLVGRQCLPKVLTPLDLLLCYSLKLKWIQLRMSPVYTQHPIMSKWIFLNKCKVCSQ